VTGFVPALDRLAVREISGRFLSQDERIEIADLRRAGLSIRQVSGRLGRAPSTVSRELCRNAAGSGEYRPFEAHRRATARRARHHRRRTETTPELRQVVVSCWRSRQLRRRFPDAKGCGCVMRASTRLFISPDHRCCARHRWLLTAARRCAPGVITSGRISTPTGAARGPSSRCLPSASGRSSLMTMSMDIETCPVAVMVSAR
jgi:hypothetical protein